MQHTLRQRALILIAAGSLIGLACSSDDSGPVANADSTGSNASGTAGGQTTQGVSASGNATAGVDTTAASGMDTAGFLPSTGTGSEPMPGPNGSPCMGPGDCESEFCYTVPTMGGFCSECLTDEDCGMGTCSVDLMLGYAVCTDGSLGVMCSSDEGCMEPLVCATVVDTGGVFPLDFCSECRDDVPCTDGQLCTPVIDIEALGGFNGCVDPMSVPNNGACPLVGGVGDGAVCQSGICTSALALGLVPIGLCGECAVDADCPGGTCTPAVADMNGVSGSICM